jgi:hypothetical protein
MPTIPKTQKAVLSFIVPANGAKSLVIPDSEKYLGFSFTLDTLAQQKFYIKGRVPGSTKLDGQTPSDFKVIVVAGTHATDDESTIGDDSSGELTQSKTYTFKLHAPMELQITAEDSANAQQTYKLAVMMTDSLYSSRL